MCIHRILSTEFIHEIKAFSGKQRPREFTTSFSLKKLLKHILQREGKIILKGMSEMQERMVCT